MTRRMKQKEIGPFTRLFFDTYAENAQAKSLAPAAAAIFTKVVAAISDGEPPIKLETMREVEAREAQRVLGCALPNEKARVVVFSASKPLPQPSWMNDAAYEDYAKVARRAQQSTCLRSRGRAGRPASRYATTNSPSSASS